MNHRGDYLLKFSHDPFNIFYSLFDSTYFFFLRRDKLQDTRGKSIKSNFYCHKQPYVFSWSLLRLLFVPKNCVKLNSGPSKSRKFLKRKFLKKYKNTQTFQRRSFCDFSFRENKFSSQIIKVNFCVIILYKNQPRKNESKICWEFKNYIKRYFSIKVSKHINSF